MHTCQSSEHCCKVDVPASVLVLREMLSPRLPSKEMAEPGVDPGQPDSEAHDFTISQPSIRRAPTALVILNSNISRFLDFSSQSAWLQQHSPI